MISFDDIKLGKKIENNKDYAIYEAININNNQQYIVKNIKLPDYKSKQLNNIFNEIIICS